MKSGLPKILTQSIIAAAAVVSFGQSPYVHNKFIATDCIGTGPLPVGVFEIMQTMDELNTYLVSVPN